jgi:hypothetical protein
MQSSHILAPSDSRGPTAPPSASSAMMCKRCKFTGKVTLAYGLAPLTNSLAASQHFPLPRVHCAAGARGRHEPAPQPFGPPRSYRAGIATIHNRWAKCSQRLAYAARECRSMLKVIRNLLAAAYRCCELVL